MTVTAWASAPASELRGTAGFGFWNDPFNPAQGTAAAPNAIWFFHASPPAHMPFTPGGAPNGWKAASLNGGAMPEWLVGLGTQLLRVPMLNQLLYATARQTALRASEVVLPTRLDQVHTYRIEWGRRAADFFVGEQHVLRGIRRVRREVDAHVEPARAARPADPLGFRRAEALFNLIRHSVG